MKVILIIDNDTNEVIHIYTLRRFIQEANKEYFEANGFCGDREYFTLKVLNFAIDWYVETSDDNISIDIMAVEVSEFDEV